MTQRLAEQEKDNHLPPQDHADDKIPNEINNDSEDDYRTKET